MNFSWINRNLPFVFFLKLRGCSICFWAYYWCSSSWVSLTLLCSSMIIIPLSSKVISSAGALAFFFTTIGLPLCYCWKWNCSLSRSYFSNKLFVFSSYSKGYSTSIPSYFCKASSSSSDSEASPFFYSFYRCHCCMRAIFSSFFFFFSRVSILRVCDNILRWAWGIISSKASFPCFLVNFIKKCLKILLFSNFPSSSYSNSILRTVGRYSFWLLTGRPKIDFLQYSVTPL